MKLPIALSACLLLAAVSASAERPADMLARMRGVPSTNSGPLGSAFPAQYVEAYAFTPRRPVLVVLPPAGGCRPPGLVTSLGGFTRASLGCPAPGLGLPGTTVTTVTTTTTVTTVTSGDAGGIVLAAPPIVDPPEPAIPSVKFVPPRELAPPRP